MLATERQLVKKSGTSRRVRERCLQPPPRVAAIYAQIFSERKSTFFSTPEQRAWAAGGPSDNSPARRVTPDRSKSLFIVAFSALPSLFDQTHVLP